MLDIAPIDSDRPTDDFREQAAAFEPAPSAAEAPSPRDWSNVVFSVVFCEEARRAYDNRSNR